MNFEDALIAFAAAHVALFALGLVSGLCLVCLSKAFQRARRARQSQDSGNVFFALFGAVALAGLIGASALTTMKGPTAALTTSNRQATAANGLYTAARLIAEARQATPDCDTDGIVEPPPWRDGHPAPQGGGLIPYDIAGAKRDPWGTELGYCVWDHGKRTVSDDIAACGGAAVNRLEGHDSKSEYVIAVISAGPDRAFQTTCTGWHDADADGRPDEPLIATSNGSDDIIHTETMTALTAESSSQLQQLPEEACTPAALGTMRYDAGTVQICRDTGWQEVGSAIAASGNFIPKIDAELSSEHTSNAITFSGFNGTRTASVDGGAILIVNGIAQGSTATISAGDEIAIKAMAAASPATTTVLTLHVSTANRSFSITTRDALPPQLTILPAMQTDMDVEDPGPLAYGTTVRFTVTNVGEAATAPLLAAELSNTDNFELDSEAPYVGDGCQGQILAAGATCVIDIRPKATTGGPYSGALTVSDADTSANATLSGQASAPVAIHSCQTIAAGTHHTCALGTDDKAYCWGGNSFGQLGDDSTGDRWVPVLVEDGAGPGTYTQLATGETHTCGLGTDSRAYCWGNDATAQVGGGEYSISHYTMPIPVKDGAGPGTYTQLAIGRRFSCGLGTDGKAYCWGGNSSGQLGDSSILFTYEPILAQNGDGPGTYKQLTANWLHVCGLATDDRAYCWGSNGATGTLGDNSTEDRWEPTRVHDGAGPGTYVYLAAGTTHTCGLGTDGKAYCWGNNFNGQLGDNSTTQHLTPALADNGDGPGTYQQLAAGMRHTCGLGTDDKAYCWGRNQNGQLGDDSTDDRWVPTRVHDGAGPGTFALLTAGYNHTCGLGTDGQAYCWGENAKGQLGDDSTTQLMTPALVDDGDGPGTYATTCSSAPPSSY